MLCCTLAQLHQHSGSRLAHIHVDINALAITPPLRISVASVPFAGIYAVPGAGSVWIAVGYVDDLLGVERSNLYRKMRSFGIASPRRGDDEPQM